MALERSEVAVALIDAAQPLGEQDVRILNMVSQAGRALVIVFNKWDLVDSERRGLLEREIDLDLGPWSWAPRVNLSAPTKWHVNRLAGAVERSLANWD